MLVKLNQEDNKHQEAIMRLFDGETIKLENWMFDFKNIEEVAEKWCLKHDIPEDQRPAKIKELVDRYNYTLSISFIILKPLPIESSQNP